jgi:hypothetical protein
MTVSELRIGNLVNGIYADNYGHLKIDEKETICKVTTLDISDLSDYPIYVESDEGIEHFDEFEGIPLTEEWLLKFGFEKVLNQYKKITDVSKDRFKNIPFIILFLDNQFQYDDLRFRTNLQYVHQLQNIYFALTGEELTIKQQEQ